jgi:hypothetical protein
MADVNEAVNLPVFDSQTAERCIQYLLDKPNQMSDREKTLVYGNIRGFWQHLHQRGGIIPLAQTLDDWPLPPEPSGAEPAQPCLHEHLDMDGICHKCGADHRGISPEPSAEPPAKQAAQPDWNPYKTDITPTINAVVGTVGTEQAAAEPKRHDGVESASPQDAEVELDNLASDFAVKTQRYSQPKAWADEIRVCRDLIVMQLDQLSKLAANIESACAAEKDSYLLHHGGIVEIAVRNQNVADYCKHWEERAKQAESRHRAKDVIAAQIAEKLEQAERTIERIREAAALGLRIVREALASPPKT